MPGKVSIAQMREWLDLYESGRSIEKIASKENRDTRTVKRCIDQIRRERYAEAAKAAQIKDALQKHNDDLMGVINRFLTGPAGPIYFLDLRRTLSGQTTSIPLSGGIANYDEESGWMVKLHAEEELLYELLREHLRRDKLWKRLDSWKKALAQYVESSIDLMQKGANILKEESGGRGKTKAEVDRYSQLVDLLYRLAAAKAINKSGEINIAPSEYDDYVVRAGARIGQETGDVEVKYRELEEARKKAKRELEEISLLPLIQGDCRVCKRLGL